MGPTSLTLGFFGNPFLLVTCVEGGTNAINLRAQVLHRGETVASDAGTHALLKVVVNLPLEDKSIDNLKRMAVVASVVLPQGNGFLAHLQQHIISFGHYNLKWKNGND